MTRPADARAARRLRSVQAFIARRLLGDPAAPAVTLGEVSLRPHQVEALARVAASLDEHGGALLADAPGLGKTYVALAAARDARAPVVVAPAGTREMWYAAMDATGVNAPFLTHEALSRRRPASLRGGVYDLVIVDEAHHARTPTTRRYRALAALTRGARVLLLSATPVHNRSEDLVALLALFLGTRARRAPDALLARCIVRRDHDDVALTDESTAAAAYLPDVRPIRTLPLASDDDLLDAILALPPPLGPSHDAAGALVVQGLVRQWASSEAALRGAVARRLARALALEAALADGHRPDRRALARWATEEGAQLGFAALLAPPEPQAAELLPAVREHAMALTALLRRLDTGTSRDAERAAELQLLLDFEHVDERIVAFSCFAATVRGLWRQLSHVPHVAALTSAGARVAGGPIARTELLRRFAPRSHGLREPLLRDRVNLLLTTDLAGEGINLQDASVVVHLDMPWTPARLEQRVGRVARLGCVRDVVHVYAFMPPARAERMLEAEARLRVKLRRAARVVGMAGAIVPAFGTCLAGTAPAPAPEAVRSAPQLAESIRSYIALWRRRPREPAAQQPHAASAATSTSRRDRRVAAVVVEGGPPAALALCRLDGRARLVAIRGDRVGDDPATTWRVLRALDGGIAAEPAAENVAAARRALRRWVRARAAARTAGVDASDEDRRFHRVHARLSRVVASAPRHARTAAAERAESARRAASRLRGAGDEAAVDELLHGVTDDIEFATRLRVLPATSDARDIPASSTAGRPPARSSRDALLALIVLQPPDAPPRPHDP